MSMSGKAGNVVRHLAPFKSVPAVVSFVLLCKDCPPKFHWSILRTVFCLVECLKKHLMSLLVH